MIKVVVVFDSKGHVSRFDVTGHAGFDVPGKDIVCAAVSAVVQSAVIGLTEVIGLDIEYMQKNGNAHCIIPDNIDHYEREKADIVLKTMLYGLRSIQTGYSNFVSVLEKETR